MRIFIALILGWVPFCTYSQVFHLDTTEPNGQMTVGEIQLPSLNNYENRYLGSKNTITRMNGSSWDWVYSIRDTNTPCLHQNSYFKDLELLSNGSLAGIFYHDESCITPESVFVMLDSNGNVLVDKRFAKGIPLFNGGIVQKDSVVHVYANHYIGNYEQGGLTHFQYSLSGVLLDSNIMITDFYQGYNNGMKKHGDSLIVIYAKYIRDGTYLRSIAMTDFDIKGTVRIIAGDTLNGITSYKIYDNSIIYVFGRGNYLGYRSGIAKVDLNGQNFLQDTSILGSSIGYGDVIKMKDYYVVTEFNHNPGHIYQNLIIYDTSLTIINRQLVDHNVNQSRFIKTSDSTFLIYDESYTYEYTMNFDSIPGYVNSVNTLISNYDSELQVQVYPNPTSNSVTVQYPHSQRIEVSLFTISGVELAKKNEHNSTETIFDLSAFPKGLYLVQVKTEQEIQIVKVVKK